MCKIRLLKTHHDTVELARQIEKTGVAAIAVHGRKVADSPRDPAQWDGIAEVVSALYIPVISNGDVFEYSDFQCIKGATAVAAACCLNTVLMQLDTCRNLTLVGRLPSEELMEKLPSFLPVLFDAFGNQNAEV